MLKQLTNVTVWVHDQDEALAFYTEKLGMQLARTSRFPSSATSAGSPSASRGSPTSASRSWRCPAHP